MKEKILYEVCWININNVMFEELMSSDSEYMKQYNFC